MDYKCGHCGYEGPCYGQATSKGVSAPWCRKCERNDKLTKLVAERIEQTRQNFDNPRPMTRLVGGEE